MKKQLFYLLVYCCVFFQGCTILSWEINGNRKPVQYLSEEFGKQEEARFRSKHQVTSGYHPKPGNDLLSNEKNKIAGTKESLPLNKSLPFENIDTVLSGINMGARAPVKTQSQIIEDANKKAMIFPDSSSFHNAVVKFKFEENATYVIYTAVGRVTKIEFQKGDNIIKVVGGDSVNWLLEQCVVKGTPHLFIKPIYPDLETNLSILTERYSYYIYIKSYEKMFMVGVEWVYPQEEKKRYNEYLEKKKRSGINDLKINYRVESKCTDCIEPASLYVDYDAGKMYVKMPEQIRHSSLPVIFSLDAEKKPQLINYRFLEDELTFVIDGKYPVLMLRYEGGKGRDVYIKEFDFKKKKGMKEFFPGLFGF